MRQEYIDAVRRIVAMVPRGTAVAYSDISDLLGQGGPRQIGAIMARHSEGLSWWRVLRASGEAPSGHEPEAFRRYREEGTPLRGQVEDFARTGEGRWRVDFPAARWAPREEDFLLMDALADALRRSEAEEGAGSGKNVGAP
ncbi:MGMT family protein [Arthrobacter woluwensis]|uniref:Alkylated DNA nucleotide flippase Atl1, participates in nucleotide excision repair, Ada-like DNA-binding domain n=1 Tax=Arthrobacter woluwensis TaxID=156980 RepID=A0A1H4MQL9_9MICC|nr:MGMT family protein [Arthrobacter woluwensis]SEB85450.1 Alkylated DNA nucleotide flippase Atl1, participates in nucleotide excision repair, Ada-like DNA-binding domain [Arthrobacter woluwensis]